MLVLHPRLDLLSLFIPSSAPPSSFLTTTRRSHRLSQGELATRRRERPERNFKREASTLCPRRIDARVTRVRGILKQRFTLVYSTLCVCAELEQPLARCASREDRRLWARDRAPRFRAIVRTVGRLFSSTVFGILIGDGSAIFHGRARKSGRTARTTPVVTDIDRVVADLRFFSLVVPRSPVSQEDNFRNIDE